MNLGSDPFRPVARALGKLMLSIHSDRSRQPWSGGNLAVNWLAVKRRRSTARHGTPNNVPWTGSGDQAPLPSP
jgi:hypothetical protein